MHASSDVSFCIRAFSFNNSRASLACFWGDKLLWKLVWVDCCSSKRVTSLNSGSVRRDAGERAQVYCNTHSETEGWGM